MRFSSTIQALALIVPTLSAAQSPEGGEPLDPYISCQYSGGLSPVSITRLPGRGVRHRTVQTASGEKNVSVADGYTVLLGQGEPGYFANIKFEKSDPPQYTRDKDAVIKSFELASQSALAQKKGIWEHMPFNGFDDLSDATVHRAPSRAARNCRAHPAFHGDSAKQESCGGHEAELLDAGVLLLAGELGRAYQSRPR